jgi:WD40 repeat protein
MVLILLSLVSCSIYPNPITHAGSATKTTEQALATIVTPTISFTATPQLPPSITPIPAPINIGSLGRGAMSDIFRSQNGQIIAVGIGNTLHWYDNKTFKEIGSLSLGLEGIMTIRFSPEGNFVGVESGLSEAQVVDLDHQAIVATIHGLNGPISNLSLTPDNQYVALQMEDMRAGGSVVLWNISTDKLERGFDVLNLEQPHVISGPVVSPDGKLVAAGSDKQIYIWDLVSGERKFILDGHTEDITSIDFSPDGKWLASGSRDHTVRLWDTITGNRIQVVSGMADEIFGVKFSSDGKQLKIDGWGYSIYLWDFNTKKLITLGSQSTLPDPFAVKMHYDGFSQNWLPDSSGKVLFSPDGHSLALGSEPILVWDLGKRTVIASLENIHSTFMTKMQYSLDGRWLAARDDSGNLQVWDMHNIELQIRRENSYYSGVGTQAGTQCFAFSLDSSTLAIASDGALEVWDIEAAMLRSTITLDKGTQRINHLAFSSDGAQLYAVLDLNDRQVAQTWDVMTGKLLNHFELPENSKGVFSATGMYWPYFARNNADGAQSWIEIWNLETGKIVSKPKTPRPETEPLQFSPDGRLIMAISNSNLYVWQANTGELIFSINRVPYNSGMAISPDNQLLAVDRVGYTELWDISQIVKNFASP